MEIGLVTAFLGGVLALLSPCSALLLPAFFAATIGTRLRLLVHGAVFYVGLIVTLVPFGMGIGALGALLIDHRDLIINVTAVVLVVLGILLALGIGFDLSRAMPGANRLQARAGASSGLLRTFLFGAAGGVAGFCTGPILGAVLTLSLGRGGAWFGGLMLAVYAAGMVVPLLVLAVLWTRLGERGRSALRGRTVTIAGRELHTTSLVTGVIIATVGVLFWWTNGFIDLPSPVPTSVTSWLQERSGVLAGPWTDVLAIVAVAAVILVVWARRRASGSAVSPAARADAADPDAPDAAARSERRPHQR